MGDNVIIDDLSQQGIRIGDGVTIAWFAYLIVDSNTVNYSLSVGPSRRPKSSRGLWRAKPLKGSFQLLTQADRTREGGLCVSWPRLRPPGKIIRVRSLSRQLV